MLEWLLGYAGSKASDRIFATLWGPTLNRALLQQVKVWSEALPPEQMLVAPEALFPVQTPDEGLHDRPSLLAIRKLIGSGSLPGEALWHTALVEQWQSVRKLIVEPQPFFQCNLQTASNHLQTLAAHLYKTCVQQPELFQPQVIALLDRAAEQGRELGGKTDAIAQSVKAVESNISKNHQEITGSLEDNSYTLNSVIVPSLSSIDAALRNIIASQTEADKKFETAVDQQIDAYVELIPTDPDTSLKLLNQLRAKLGTPSSKRLHYRVEANIAACNFELGRDELAADQFIATYDIDPTHGNAAANKALGLLIKKDLVGLKQFASDTLRASPDNAALAGYLIQGVAHDHTIEDPLALVPKELHGKPHVQISYIRWLMDRGAPGQWRESAISEYERAPETEGLSEYYANALLDSVVEQTGFETGYELNEQQATSISKSAQIFESIWQDVCEGAPHKRLTRISIPLNLMLAYRLLNNGDDAIRVGSRALELFPDNDDVKQRLAATLLEYGHDSRSRDLVLSLPLNADTAMMRLNLFIGAKQWKELDDLVANSLDVFPSHEQAIARTAQIISRVERAEPRERENILEACKGQNVDDTRVNMMLAQSARLNGFYDLSDHFFEVGLSALDSPQTRYADRITAAHAAIGRDEPGMAARILYGHVSINHDSSELRMLARAIAHDFPPRARAGKFFSEVPEKVRSLPFYRRAEGIYHINRGFADEAVPLFEESLSKDRTLSDLMGLIVAHLRIGNSEKVRVLLSDNSFDQLPGVPIDKLNYCHLLLDFAFADRAIRLGYETLLENTDRSDLVMKFIGLTLKPTTALKIPNPLVVGPGAWVALTEESGTKYSALVGEQADRPWGQAVLLENSFIARALGRSVGDTFEHTTAFGLVQKWTISEIKPNWLQAAHSLSESFNQRFPEASGFATVTMKAGEIQPALDQVKRSSEALRGQADLCINNNVPLAIAAGARTGGAIGFAEFIADIGKDVRTCVGNSTERQEALDAIAANLKNGAVLDAFTAWTSAELDLLEVLQFQLGPLSIPSTELDTIRTIIREQEEDIVGERMSLSYREGQFYRTILTEEQKTGNLQICKERLNRIESFCTIEPAVLADALPAQIETLISVVSGEPFIPMALASTDRLLLSDDLALRRIGFEAFNTKGVWLQAVLLSALKDSAISLERYADALVLLSARRHCFVSVDAKSMHSVFTRDESVILARFQAICTYLGSVDADAKSHLTLAANFINKIWADAVWDDLKTCRATSIVLRSLILRHRGDAWPAWAAGLYSVFNSRAKAYFVGWCRGHFLPIDQINDFLKTVNQRPIT